MASRGEGEHHRRPDAPGGARPPRGTATERTVEYFDSIASGYASLYDEPTVAGYAFTVRRERVLELFDRPGGQVLDVGCGPGVLVGPLVALGCEFMGVDPSPTMIEEARQRWTGTPGVRFETGLAEDLDVPDASFDAVVCTGVIERVADDGRALAEMARVLRPGGSLLLSAPHRWSPNLQWRDRVFYPAVDALRPVARRLRVQVRPVVRGHRLYTRRSLAALLDSVGCRDLEARYCSYNPLPQPLDGLFPRAAAGLMRRAEVLHRSPLRALGAMVVVRAHKLP